MNATTASLALSALTALAGPSGAQGFVERAQELGLVHHAQTGMDAFVSEVTDEIGIDWLQSGVAVGDIDGDGDLDVVGCGSLAPNTLLLQGEDGFTDATAASGIDSREFDRVPALGDYDRNGTLDLFIAACEGMGTGPRPGRCRLYRNEGGAVFEDVTSLAGTTGNGRSLYAQWNDLDLDGMLDLYVGEFYLTPNLWYRNNGDGSFTDLTDERGLGEAGSAHVAAGFDSDRDGDPDVFVGNDYKIASSLEYPDEINPGDEYFVNENGTFDEISKWVGLAINMGIMGFAWGDVNYDGWMDVYKTDVQSNKLVMNFGAPGSLMPWTYQQSLYGIANAEVPFGDGPQMGAAIGWSAFFFNADLDRWLDLYVVNGHVAAVNAHINNMPQNQPNFLFHGDGPANGFAFTDQTAAFGLWERYDDRGAAMTDLDADGDIDLLVLEDAGRLRYHENRVDRAGQGWILVEAETHTSVPGGVGTLVEWTDSEDYLHMRVIGVDAPTASQNQHMAYFGLGTEPSADLVVTFPSGIQQTYTGVLPNTRLTAVEPQLFEVSTRTLPVAGATFGDDEVTVTAFAHAPDGSLLDGTATVDITVPGLAPTGPVTHVAGNRFERTFATSSIPREYRVEASFDGWTPLVAPRVHVFGPPNAVQSRVLAVPGAVRSGVGDTFEVWVAPRDANGVAIGPGRAVTIEIPSLASGTGVVDHGDGRYSASFTAREPMAATALVTCEGADITPLQPTIEVAGPVDAAMTVVDIQASLPPQASTPHQIKVQITPRDAAGRRLGPHASISLRVLSATQADGLGAPGPVVETGNGPGPGASSATSATSATGSVGPFAHAPHGVHVHPDYGHVGQDDGDFLFILEKTPLEGYLPYGSFEVKVQGTVLGTYDYAYKPELH